MLSKYEQAIIKIIRKTTEKIFDYLCDVQYKSNIINIFSYF